MSRNTSKDIYEVILGLWVGDPKTHYLGPYLGATTCGDPDMHLFVTWNLRIKLYSKVILLILF